MEKYIKASDGKDIRISTRPEPASRFGKISQHEHLKNKHKETLLWIKTNGLIQVVQLL